MLPAFRERSSQSFHRPVIFLAWSSRRHFCRRLVDFWGRFKCDFHNFTHERRTPMQGLMMDYPLTLQHFFNRVTRLFPRKEIITQPATVTHRYPSAECGKPSMQLANSLHNAGVTHARAI